MKYRPDLLQAVVIDSPYESFEALEMQDFFLQALAIKLKSYQNIYPAGVLPLDTYDFISTHHLIGHPEAGARFRALMVFRTVSLARCEKHNLPFPGLAVLRGSGAELHAQVLERLLHECKAREESVSYGSGWAIAPALREDRELRNHLKDLMTAMLVNHELEMGTKHLVACGTARVHTDEYFQNIGYQRVAHAGAPLPSFAQASLIGTEAVLLHTRGFNDRAMDLARQHRKLWDERLLSPARRADLIPLHGPVRRKAA